MVTDAVDIARFLISLACHDDPEPDPLTNMRLQKLLYYAQGWSLAMRDRPMFADRIEAWPHGPVVPDAYRAFKQCGAGLIDEEGDTDINLTRNDQSFLRSLWGSYRQYPVAKLWAMTHSEPPWQQARGNLPANAQSKARIADRSMRSFFSEKLREFEPMPGLEWDKIARAQEDLEAGRGVRFQPG